MVVGVSYEEVVEVTKMDPNKGHSFHEIFDKFGFSKEYYAGDPIGDFVNLNVGILAPSFFRMLAWGRKAIMSVPSINYDRDPEYSTQRPGLHSGKHAIYFDGWRVWDPSPRKKYTKFSDLLPDEMVLFRYKPEAQLSRTGKHGPAET